MKTLLSNLLMIIIVSSLMITSCKKDEEQKKNSFKHGDKETLLGSGFIMDDGSIEGTVLYGKELYLLETTLYIHELNGDLDSISGKGDAIGFMLISTDPTGINSGDYTYNANPDEYKAGTFGWETSLMLNIEPNGTSFVAPVMINGGKLSVTKNNDEYELSFDLTTAVNTTVKGYFKGKLKSYSN